MYFYSIIFSSVKPRVVSSAPEVYGTSFSLRIHGTRCLQLKECFSSLQSFLGFVVVIVVVVLRRLKKDEVIQKNATPLVFFFKEIFYIYICVCICSCVSMCACIQCMILS